MSENSKWIREYELVFSGESERLVIDSRDQTNPLDISFTVSYNPKANTQGTMSLDIYGLSEASVSKILKTGVKAWLKVGYRDKELVTLFIGDVREAHVESASGKHVTKIKCMTSRSDVKPLIKIFPEDTIWAERLVDIMQSVKESIPSLDVERAIGDLSTILQEEQNRSDLTAKELSERTLLSDSVTGALVVSDPAMTVLTNALATFNIKPLTVNDTLYLIRSGGKIESGASNVELIKAALGENLLTPPRRIVDNMTVTPNTILAKEEYAMLMLLEPTVKPNSIVEADHVRNDLGTVEEGSVIIKVTEITHTGHYRSGNWYTEVKGTPSESFYHRAPIVTVAWDIENTYLDPSYSEFGSDFIGAGISRLS